MNVSNPADTLPTRVRSALDQLRSELLDERTADGHWCGQLSPSALSTATAVSAISAVLLRMPGHPDAAPMRDQVARGVGYLAGQQNDDGGFGDTDRSHSNIATSYLVLAGSALAGECIGRSLSADSTERLRQYLVASGELEGLRRRYGKDKTFVVPIMTNLAIAGLVDWSEVSALPFEAAVFPQSMYRFLGMPVVSYAIPALVAIGQARHHHGPRAWWPLRQARSFAVEPSLKVLRRMQPDSGGYLEATPLTSFVVMSLASTGRADLDVCREGLRFLSASMTEEGSWPIDTNLATWVTSLAIHALACDPADDGRWCQPSLVDWHLGCQHRRRHPFTGARPGGWGWSDLSGAVPDSDDTPAAILALDQIRRWTDPSQHPRLEAAIERGREWLVKLQNRDGGWPTFCRGWGKLPFDRSSTDLTGHALRALRSGSQQHSGNQPYSGNQSRGDRRRGDDATRLRGAAFLHRSQQPDGSWLPLWFGNQDCEDESNPVYGTARVLLAAEAAGLDEAACRRGCGYLLAVQNGDGGWGGGPSVGRWFRVIEADRSAQAPSQTRFAEATGGGAVTRTSSIEETALAVEALASMLLSGRNFTFEAGVESDQDESQRSNSPSMLTAGGKNAVMVAIIRGIEFLLGSVDDGRHRVPWPIGFYFAKLWYHERLYPLIFTVAALGMSLRVMASEAVPDRPR